eukprot:1427917-Prymnesium_polylepis.1
MLPRRAAIASIIAFFRRAAPLAPRGGVAAPREDDAREVFVSFTEVGRSQSGSSSAPPRQRFDK